MTTSLAENQKRDGRTVFKAYSDLGEEAVFAICPALNKLLADVFALYLKTHLAIDGPSTRKPSKRILCDRKDAVGQAIRR